VLHDSPQQQACQFSQPANRLSDGPLAALEAHATGPVAEICVRKHILASVALAMPKGIEYATESIKMETRCLFMALSAFFRLCVVEPTAVAGNESSRRLVHYLLGRSGYHPQMGYAIAKAVIESHGLSEGGTPSDESWSSRTAICEHASAPRRSVQAPTAR
jgi:hypothetical protein